MKNSIFKILADNFSKLMRTRGEAITPKELSEKSHISYSTLAPILRGERDFGITRLIAIAEALETTPNEILRGAYNANLGDTKGFVQPRYLASFLTDVKYTKCQVYDLITQQHLSKTFSFTIYCNENPYNTLLMLKNAIKELCDNEINFQAVCVYASALRAEHTEGAKKLYDYGLREFGTFILEPDWKVIHKSIFKDTNGILITINDGYAISYSNDASNDIKKISGYGFPISDDAGNLWLGCEALKHAVNVYEGIEKMTLLADRILSHFSSDINLLAIKAYDKPREAYINSSVILKELAVNESKSKELLKKSFDNIWQRVMFIDKQSNQLPKIALAGDLAYLYEQFIPKDRLNFLKIGHEADVFKLMEQALKTKIKTNL